jgi:RNA polymerase sigma factor (sigma-70 family)
VSEPWISELLRGDAEAAWDLFIERYRRLIFATIRRLADDHDDVMDIFARVCEALRENDVGRLRKFAAQPKHSARFSTWLVAVVRNQTIDWFRHRDGRKRLSTRAALLSTIQHRIFEYLSDGSYSHVEAYELVTNRDGAQLKFHEYLREVRALYATLSRGRRGQLLRELCGPLPPEEAQPSIEARPANFDARERLASAMATLKHDERVAVQLFVIDELPAAEVARIVGWPNAKTVYNRVYRSLAALRALLERAGVMQGDL